MAILSYLTTTHFDFDAIRLLPKELERLGMRRPLIATDHGVRAAGLLDALLDADLSSRTNPRPVDAAAYADLFRAAL